MLKNNFRLHNRVCRPRNFNIISETFDDGSSSLDKFFTNYLNQGASIRLNSVKDNSFENTLRYDDDPLDYPTKYENAERFNVDIFNDESLSHKLSNENTRIAALKDREAAKAASLNTESTGNA